MFKISIKIFFAAVTFLLLSNVAPPCFAGWPTTGQWIPVYKNGAFIQDDNGDANGARNIVSDSSHPAAFIYYDGTYVYFRLRLDSSPGTPGNLVQFGWGVEFDTNQNSNDYEWLALIDGKGEQMYLEQNTVQGSIGDPADKCEVIAATLPLIGNAQVNQADTAINGDQDYFLDWRFDYGILKSYLGITDSTPIRLFFGSSSSTQSLTPDGADMCGGTGTITLAQGLSDYIILAGGTRPTDGSVKFVSDISGSGSVIQVTVGDTIYVRVDDADRNYDNATKQTVPITLATAGGDSETLTLTETGVNTGIFTGSMATAAATTVTPGDGKLQIKQNETVTATYIDTLDSNLNQNVPRTATLQVNTPSMSASKSASPPVTVVNGDVAFTITLTNSGTGAGRTASLTDTLPSGFSYVSGSTTGYTTSSGVATNLATPIEPSISGQTLAWANGWTVPAASGGVNGTLVLTFHAKASGVTTVPGTYTNNVTCSGSNFTQTVSASCVVTISTGPQMTLTKSVDKTNAPPGAVLTYTVYYHNIGGSPAQNAYVVDSIPLNTTYVPGSLRMGNAGSTYATAAPKTDAVGDDEAEVNGNTVVFRLGTVGQDDGVPNSGSDEGKVYMQVKIK